MLGLAAVVAGAAVVLVVGLAEIVQQDAPAAQTRLGVVFRLAQELAADLLLGEGFALHKLVELLEIQRAVERHTEALAAVSAGASGLLVVALQALGDVVVDDVAHIGLVDTHAEGDGGHDDVDALHDEVVLRLGPLCAVHAGMIRTRIDIVRTKHLGQLFHLTS